MEKNAWNCVYEYSRSPVKCVKEGFVIKTIFGSLRSGWTFRCFHPCFRQNVVQHNTQQISRIIARNGPTLCITGSHYTHGKIAVCHFTPLSNFSPLLPGQRQRDRNLSLTLHLFKIVLCVINIHVLYLCALNFTQPYVILVYCYVDAETLWCKTVLWTETFDE